MRYLIGLIIILECIYQLFGISTSVNWSVYYELIKYLGLFSITIMIAYDKWDKLLFHFSLFFLFMTGINLPYFCITRDEYLTRSRSNDVHYIVLFAIFVLIIYLISKKWRKLKIVGK